MWAKANYNMSFDRGHFRQNKFYQYEYNKTKEKVNATTEEGTEQQLWTKDFNILFARVPFRGE